MFKKIIGIFLLLFGMIGLEGCVISKSNTSIVGSWAETWGVGEDTNVDYSDVYLIEKQGGNFKMTCPKRKNYLFESVSFDGKELKAKLIIKDLKYDADDTWVDYSMQLQDNQQSFKGTALTKAGKQAKILWTKLRL